MGIWKLALICAAIAEGASIRVLGLPIGINSVLEPLAAAVGIFHWPGVLVARSLYPNGWFDTTQDARSSILFVVLAGFAQWYVLAYCVIALKRKYRKGLWDYEEWYSESSDRSANEE
jgi:hypothetical protein